MEENVKGKNNSRIIIAVLCVLLLASIGFICYDKLLKKEEKECPKTECQCEKCEVCEQCNCSQNQEETENNKTADKIELKKVKLTSSNQNVVINGATLKIRVTNKELFVNDVKVYKYDSFDIANGVYDIFVNNSLRYGIIAQEYESMCGSEPTFEGAINSKGEFVKIEYKAKDSTACLDGMYNQNNKYFAHYSGDYDNYDMEITIK